MQAVLDLIDRERERFVRDLIEIVRIPSISSSPAHKEEVARCAAFLRAAMVGAGLSRAEVIETPGHPVVYGEWLGAPGRPTLLIYGHYDVQPVDPLDLWVSPPFEPRIREEKHLYGRGTVDDKGQVYCHLKAVEAWMATHRSLPCNVKMIIEGEEEIGSEHLGPFLERHRDLLAADAVIVSDTAMLSSGLPSICYGLRGLCYMEVRVKGPAQDLHSGSFGGGVANPVNALARIIAKLKDRKGRVRIPGFYDRVRKLGKKERRRLAALPWDETAWLAAAGARRGVGEKGYTTLERIWARPTLDVNGIWGGFQGPGSKTVIPATAGAKVSMRLVPDQDPDEIAALFADHVRRVAPASVEVEVVSHHGGRPFLTATGDPAFRATERALEKAFGTGVSLIREGGSIPFVATIEEALRRPCILMGFGLPDENSHAPNERLDLVNYHLGIKASAILYEELAGGGEGG